MAIAEGRDAPRNGLAIHRDNKVRKVFKHGAHVDGAWMGGSAPAAGSGDLTTPSFERGLGVT
jgi:hypothetical protein